MKKAILKELCLNPSSSVNSLIKPDVRVSIAPSLLTSKYRFFKLRSPDKGKSSSGDSTILYSMKLIPLDIKDIFIGGIVLAKWMVFRFENK